ncbi:MAG TPA: 16S rRNA (uracil(1498)-N(3))-methyltransferase, partial [Methylophilaceae bacterium]|jgi:16S rRNA (uracil1498-N3)-methyltransferase|nr:16S rRNA (uracil(1498)-N(3))-methyltransferase [Methylophilaceae bacterium]
MPKNRFYSPEQLALGVTVKLPESAAIHAARALRMTEGDSAILFNGDGVDYVCILTTVKKSAVLAQVTDSTAVENESPLNITLLQGISSGDRMDYTVQKAVELGVKHIQPIATERSVVKLNPARTAKRLAHWQSVVHSACEQSGRAVIPQIATPISLNKWLANHPQNNTGRILLNPIGAKRLVELVKPNGEIQLLIGAEGGLSPNEIDMAETNGFQSVILGPRILRTETAALAAIASMHTVWGDF